MVATPLKALYLLLGAGGAAAGTAYVAGVFDPYLAPAQPVAAISQPVPSGQTPDTPAKPGDVKVAANPPDAAQPSVETPANAAPSPPAFDILRVDPDGSVVIAGTATPGSTVEILSGSTVLGKVAAGPGGDFAAVLDSPLKPGDYQIVLRSIGPGSLTLNSIETAIVAVPSEPGGQVLALVEQPGAPSKLITPPVAEPAKPADTTAASLSEPSKPATTAPDAIVKVEAVEIEGRRVFVAGAAPAGSTVRAYANEILLGDAKASPEGRFLIETERDLPVGDYVIRADVLSPDGSKVVARAAVPFQREAGETVAAVVPAPPATSAGSAPAQNPAGAAAPVAKPMDLAATPAPSEPAMPAQTTAPKLEPSASGVIIRRGDTLWRISKRVYGRGTRYSTIYVANKEQISNPDRIWPGQIFRVPDKSDEGESADMKSVEGQSTAVQ